MNLKPSSCGCCLGLEPSTPAAIYNRPGLSHLNYRVGDYASFLESMLARLSTLCLGSDADCKAGHGEHPLQKLTTRNADDFSIALLHAWATLAEVLSFYQERLANEGYLRTATERRSVLELARLIGYSLRPGVSASVFLAYTLDDLYKEEALIAPGARAQSIPAPGELPQSFETGEALRARSNWNNLEPRMSRPQTFFSVFLDAQGPRIYLKGIAIQLKPDDPLLIDFSGNDHPLFFNVKQVIPDALADRTLVYLQTQDHTFGPSFDLIKILIEKDSIQFILLDAGEGLPGFYAFSIDNQQNVSLYSVQDGSQWSLTTSMIQRAQWIQLSQGELNLSYEVITITSVASEDFSYIRVTLNTRQAYGGLLQSLNKPPSVQPRNATRLIKGLAEQFQGVKQVELRLNGGSIFNDRLKKSVSEGISVQGLSSVADASNAVLKLFAPRLQDNLSIANANAQITEANPIKVYALRAKAAPFGYNAPLRPTAFNLDKGYTMGEWVMTDPYNDTTNTSVQDYHKPNVLYLDADYPILPNTWIVIQKESSLLPSIIRLGEGSILHKAIAAYGMSSKTTQLDLPLGDEWIAEQEPYSTVRNTVVYGQSEALELAEEPISKPVCGGVDDLIELADYYEALQPGRWVIVTGERADTPGTSGVRFSELAMLSLVQQDIYHQSVYEKDQETRFNLPGDKVHSFIKLANKLEFCFKRDTVKIYGNVVKATHGETKQETLGSGNSAKTLQSFTLKQSPLTFVSASNASGADSSLKVTVNGVEWHESASLNRLQPASRSFISKTDDDDKTTLIFGDGVQGALLPTGVENIKAEYRMGIGKPGNVKAGQISLLTTRPLGVKEVVNPLRASGGADRESLDQARKNAPLAVMALDRLVSVQDYQDFSRVFAGIGKAYAAELSDGRRQIVHVTIAGVDDAPIDETSDLFINLRQALHDEGDPFQPIQLAIRELMLLVISAKVKIQVDYPWELVVSSLRAALLDAFGFERQELGEDVMLAEVIRVMQGVAGVAYIDIEAFGGVPEKEWVAGVRKLLTPGEIAEKIQAIADAKMLPPCLKVNLSKFESGAIRPAQLAFLTPDVPESLILNQIL